MGVRRTSADNGAKISRSARSRDGQRLRDDWCPVRPQKQIPTHIVKAPGKDVLKGGYPQRLIESDLNGSARAAHRLADLLYREPVMRVLVDIVQCAGR